MYLQNIRTFAVTIGHNGTVNPDEVYDIISATAQGAIFALKNVLIVGFTITNRHLTDIMTYKIMSDGDEIDPSDQSIAALTCVQINAPTQLCMLGSMIQDGMGNYYLPYYGSKDLQIKITSTTIKHDASVFITCLIPD